MGRSLRISLAVGVPARVVAIGNNLSDRRTRLNTGKKAHEDGNHEAFSQPIGGMPQGEKSEGPQHDDGAVCQTHIIRG